MIFVRLIAVFGLVGFAAGCSPQMPQCVYDCHFAGNADLTDGMP